MFNFLKNWFKKDQQELRTVDELKQDLSENTSELENDVENTPAKTTDEQKMVRTGLSLHSAWERSLDEEKKYTLRFLQEALPEIIEGSVAVTGFSLIPQQGGMTVALFFRNGSDKPVVIGKMTLTLVLDDKPYARTQFDLSEVGVIPAHSSRPWEVFFPEESYMSENIAFTKWKILFHRGDELYRWPKNLDLDPEMEKRMNERQKAKLEILANNLPPVRAGIVEINPFEVNKMKNGGLFIGLLFRNGKRVTYTPKQLAIKVTDASDNVIAEGVIDTQGKVAVKEDTSRPWLVVFPPELVKLPDANLNDFKLTVRD